MKYSVFGVIGLAAGLLLAGAGCATRTAGPVAVGVVQSPETAWVRTELYFSIGDWMESALNTDAEMKWAAFLDAEVTPRFPDGLSVIDVYGQWRDTSKPGASVQRERSRLLVVVHPAEAGAETKIEEIRAAWKQQTGEKSVLRVSVSAKVGF